jgi:phosphoenolpyruvate carboxylase
MSVRILPILGTGSVPFRGNLKPTNASDMLRAYPSVQDNVMKTVGTFGHEADSRHQRITGIIMEDYSKNNFNPINENIIRAASIRGFLG